MIKVFHYDGLNLNCVQYIIERCINHGGNLRRMKLLSGTLPANSKLLSGTLSANNKLLSGTLPANNKLLSEPLPANNKL